MSNPVYQTVIVGGGFTGLFTALHLSHQHYPRSVILIDREERFCFRPLLYEYASGEMEANQVVPRFEELLRGSGVIFVQDTVQSVDLHQRQVALASGTSYDYSNLVLALGSVTNYLGVEGAKEYALPLRTQENAIAIDRHLRDCLQQAREVEDHQQRRQVLTVVVVGAGPNGVEMAGTLGDLLPKWYENLGGNQEEIRVVLLNHGPNILKGDINQSLREAAGQELQKRTVPVELVMEAEATAVRPNELEYKRHDQTETLPTATVIWTAGTHPHPLVKDLPVSNEHQDKHGRLLVTRTMQLPDFQEVFAGGDCAAIEGQSLPPTAQVAYQQGNAIAHNLDAIALGRELKPAQVRLRGSFLKLGLENSVANLLERYKVTGEPGHLIRHGTYLTLLPAPIHDFQATTQWLNEEIFERHLQRVKTADVVKWVGGAIVAAVVVRQLLKRNGSAATRRSKLKSKRTGDRNRKD
ncbi:MAG: NAD(P)/FAD-dependent oxidoreductase [Cyanobacteria bacterium QS_9_48_30]|nr:MAG: NAD(P)/FAD-dependent oxidoreductase [Cyanobacteria bacterium QS_9_48_30]